MDHIYYYHRSGGLNTCSKKHWNSIFQKTIWKLHFLSQIPLLMFCKHFPLLPRLKFFAEFIRSSRKVSACIYDPSTRLDHFPPNYDTAAHSYWNLDEALFGANILKKGKSERRKKELLHPFIIYSHTIPLSKNTVLKLPVSYHNDSTNSNTIKYEYTLHPTINNKTELTFRYKN